jgi:acyl carrier protein
MKRVKQILSKVLGIDENQITDATSPETVETWDSFNALMLVSELEKEFKVRFTMDEVAAVKNVKDIREAVKRHGVKLDESE